MVESLQESLNKFCVPDYGKTHRSPETYWTVARYCSENLVELVTDYDRASGNPQMLREIRNDIDYYLRRYHEYCIQQRDGIQAHYHEVDAEEQCDFEHLIPASRIRDLLLANVITVEQALNAPTVRLSRSKHVALRSSGWGSRTPNMWQPFLRYTGVFEAQYQTYDGTVIDPVTWTLEDHYRHIQHLTIE